MKYILGPFFKYLGLSIKFILQMVIAILYTIIWGIPTLFFYMLFVFKNKRSRLLTISKSTLNQ